jgi:penicillin amidase
MEADQAESLWPEGKQLSADQKPHSRAAERGWIASANNDPFGFTANGLLDDDPWYYGALFPPGWRANRIEDEIERLIGLGKVGVADMQALQMDVRSQLADDMIPYIVAAHAAIATDPDLAEFAARSDIDQLVQLITVDWDRQMRRDAAGAVAFHHFAHGVTANVIEDDLTSILFEIVLNAAPMYMLKVAALALAGAYPDGDVVMQEGRDRLVLMALDATSAWLTTRFGGVDPAGYTFADVRVSSMNHAFGRGVDLGSYPTDGGESTVNVAQSKFRLDGEVLPQWVSQWGPIERQVISFDAAGQPESRANFALGNVADATSPHFDDALAGWIDGDYDKLLFRRDAIEPNATGHQIPAAK